MTNLNIHSLHYTLDDMPSSHEHRSHRIGRFLNNAIETINVVGVPTVAYFASEFLGVNPVVPTVVGTIGAVALAVGEQSFRPPQT